MIRPDYRDFVRSRGLSIVQGSIAHSAKGSTWDDHKYIKRVDGTYYYPDSYEGGRHLPDGEKRSSKEDTKVFDEFDSYFKQLAKEGKAYYDEEESWETMSKERLAELYEDITGVKLGTKDLNRLYESKEAKFKGSKKTGNLSSNDIENLAKEVIKGNFGNGQQRKDLLGDDYAEVQKRVNELMAGSSGSKKVSEATDESIKKAEDAAKKASKDSKVHSGVDMDKVLAVYKKKK